MGLETNKLSNAEYSSNFADIHPAFNESRALIEANRCLYCYDAPCTKACPTGIDVPLFIKQISSGNIKGSAHTIFVSNIFGGGCARVCPTEKLCEGACVCNQLHEEPIPIGQLQRYSTDIALKEKWKLFDRKPSTGKKVAVVGAGPAGLSCAHVLAREGVDVTVYERETKGGGLMTYGVAGYKVSDQFCADEVAHILELGGIEIKYGQAVGDKIQLADLQKQYDAVFLGIGLGATRKLGVPGEDLPGVVDAISYIYDIRTKDRSKIPVGERVAVIGMGMTAIDAARQSKRLGAAEVTMVYRRTEKEKPATDKEFDGAKLDGVKTIWLAAPKEIVAKNGSVTGLVCEKMKLGNPDASGRRSPVPTGETFTLEVDMVIKALGQMPFDNLIGQTFQHKNGILNVGTDRATSVTGVFAGGDAVNGGREVVDAVEDGKIAAVGILNRLGIAARVPLAAAGGRLHGV